MLESQVLNGCKSESAAGETGGSERVAAGNCNVWASATGRVIGLNQQWRDLLVCP